MVRRFIATLLFAFTSVAGAADPTQWGAGKVDLTEKWGVEVLGIRTTAAGYMLDFRYKVTDPEKAKPIFQRPNRPVLIDRGSKMEFQITRSPTAGPMRSSGVPQAGRTYFMMFGNPGGMIRPGSQVDVRVGPFQVEGLTVE